MAKKICTICEDKKSDYVIVIPKDATHSQKAIAESLKKAFEGFVEEPLRIIADDDTATVHDGGKEILLGGTNRPESKKLMADMGYIEYALANVGGRIVLAGLSDFALSDAVDAISHYLLAFKPEALVGDPKVTMPDGFMIRTETRRFVKDAPVYRGGVIAGVNDADSDSFTVCIDETNAKEYKAYLRSLEKLGYEKFDENEIKGNLFATYTNPYMDVHTSFRPCYSTVRLTFSHKGRLPDKENVYEDKGVRPAFMIIRPNNVTNTNGVSLAMRLCDGSLIVVDGGMHEYNDVTGKDDADNMFDALVALSGEKKPRIAAWFFTHSHDDHTDCFIRFAAKYAPMVKLERLVYNFAGNSSLSSRYISYQTKIEKVATFFGPDVRKIQAHTGEELHIRDAKIEILTSMDDFYPKSLLIVGVQTFPQPYNKPHAFPAHGSYFNDTCIIFKVTLGGQTLTVLGDATFIQADRLVDMYGDYLKSDFMQLAHHGSYGGSVQLYSTISPDVVLWTSSMDRFIERIRISLNSALAERIGAKEIWPAGKGNKIFELPYTPEEF